MALRIAQKQVTHESVLASSLLGVDEAVAVLRAIVNSPEAEDKAKIEATKSLLAIYSKMLDAGVSEQLPLLRELEQYARKSA